MQQKVLYCVVTLYGTVDLVWCSVLGAVSREQLAYLQCREQLAKPQCKEQLSKLQCIGQLDMLQCGEQLAKLVS